MATASAGRPATDRSGPRTQRDRSDLSTHRLLEATAALISERGYERTTVADVGRRAGYSHGLVTRRFGSKANLFIALVERMTVRFGHEHLFDLVGDRVGVEALQHIAREIAHDARRTFPGIRPDLAQDRGRPARLVDRYPGRVRPHADGRVELRPLATVRTERGGPRPPAGRAPARGPQRPAARPHPRGHRGDPARRLAPARPPAPRGRGGGRPGRVARGDPHHAVLRVEGPGSGGRTCRTDPVLGQAALLRAEFVVDHLPIRHGDHGLPFLPGLEER